jgi:peptidoglycan hydrolase CwlO-like protein
LVTLEASKKRSAEDLKGVQSQLETLNKRKETTEESALKNKKEIGRFKTMVTESEKELKDLKSKLLEREESSRQNK